MRIGSVRVHRHNHRLLLHPFLAVATEHELRDVPLSGWFVGVSSARYLGKRLLNDAMHFIGGFHMHLVLRWGKHGFESLYQFRARDWFDSERADKLDRSGIHA
jgi:hypothetical protein